MATNMEELSTVNLELEIERALKTFSLLEVKFKENITKEEKSFDESKENLEKQFIHLAEKKSILINKLEPQSETIKEYETKLSHLRQLNISQELSSWKMKSETIKRDSERFQKLFNEKTLLLEHKTIENQSKATFSLENKKKDEAELTAYIKYTQLEMSTEKEDCIKFSFKSISQVDPDKIFYFVLHISESGVFQVPECNPKIPDIDTILAKVNQNRDMYSFIKRMRKSFVEINRTPTEIS